jgi:hypothetical protein
MLLFFVWVIYLFISALGMKPMVSKGKPGKCSTTELHTEVPVFNIMCSTLCVQLHDMQNPNDILAA